MTLRPRYDYLNAIVLYRRMNFTKYNNYSSFVCSDDRLIKGFDKFSQYKGLYIPSWQHNSKYLSYKHAGLTSMITNCTTLLKNLRFIFQTPILALSLWKNVISWVGFEHTTLWLQVQLSYYFIMFFCWSHTPEVLPIHSGNFIPPIQNEFILNLLFFGL